jgi:hypothetical protein
MDAFSAVAGHATSPAWHSSMPSGGGIHPIKTQIAFTEAAALGESGHFRT